MKKRDVLEYAALLGVAIVEILLLVFRSTLENTMAIDILLFAVPAAVLIPVFWKYRKSHMKHIYSEQELKKHKLI